LGDPNTVSSANLQANIVSVLQAGCFVGALAAFPLADIFGRKWCLIYASIFTLVGVILQAAALGHLEPLYIGRFVAGKATLL
jgi:MFS family permease